MFEDLASSSEHNQYLKLIQLMKDKNPDQTDIKVESLDSETKQAVLKRQQEDSLSINKAGFIDGNLNLSENPLNKKQVKLIRPPMTSAEAVKVL